MRGLSFQTGFKPRPIVSLTQHFAKSLFSVVAKIVTNVIHLAYPRALQ